MASNPNTMTLDECRDWLAVDEHHKILDAMGSKATVDDYYKDGPEFPPTLDGAAGAMPEGWMWSRAHDWWIGHKTGTPDGGRNNCRVRDTNVPILDLYRLAVACRMAQKDVK